MMPTRAYLRVASVAVQTFLRTVARVVGSEVIDDVVAFFRAFEGMEEGFRDRARGGRRRLLARPATGVRARHVAAPRRDGGGDVLRRPPRATPVRQVDALIVNRVHPAFGDESPAGLRATAAASCAATRRPAARSPRARYYDNLADFREIAMLERAHIEGVRRHASATTTVAYVPYLARDVYDFAALHEIGAPARSSPAGVAAADG